MLEFYSGYFHKICILSPTVKSDIKWKYAQQLEVLAENKPLKNWIRRQQQAREDGLVVDAPPIDKLFESFLGEGEFKPQIPEESFYHGDAVVGAIKKLLDDNKAMVDLLDEHGQLKTMADRILLICDDQVGSDLFVGPLKKYFVGANTRHRYASVLP